MKKCQIRYPAYSKKWYFKQRKDKHEFLRQIYHRQVSRCRASNMPAPDYTETQFIESYINDEKFIALHKTWIRSGFKTRRVPSFDIKDANKFYTLENLQVMTWEENKK